MIFFKEKLLQLFTAFDADKDGYLNGAELQDLAFQVDVLLPQMDLEKCAKEVCRITHLASCPKNGFVF
jgi:Ca2+-binding EF-hand superfamily protein